MTRLLARAPRKARSRAYVESLPKRKPITVTAGDYPIMTRAEARETGQQFVRDAQRYADWERRGKPPSPVLPPRPVRKDRMRPRYLNGQMRSFAEIVWNLCDGICAYCHREMHRVGDGPLMFTLDHVIPKSRGGKNDLDNLVGAHKCCNNEKGSMTGDEYRAHLARRGGVAQR